jgi:hypothetical protein
MTTELTPREPRGIDDDGFHGSLNSGRPNKGSFLKWNDTASWADRDGLAPPQPLLVPAIDEALQMWKDNKPEVIRDKPLPSLDDLNAAIPEREWEKGIDGKLRKPWAHIVIVYLVNRLTGEFYTFSSPTLGAHTAWDLLKDAVVTMRALRGTRVMPVVRLSERPWKTSFGMRKRPHFEIVGWKLPVTATRFRRNRPRRSSQVRLPLRKSRRRSPPTAGPRRNRRRKSTRRLTAGEILEDEMPW